MSDKIWSHIQHCSRAGKKLFALLIDPDKSDKNGLNRTIRRAEQAGVDLFFVGGSLMTTTQFEEILSHLSKHTHIPIILFPGSIYQIHPAADAILLLSLISGRNPELLIGKHVEAAPKLHKSGLEILSTGYILIDGGRQTTVGYISNTLPIPREKPEIAACTALAGNMLGMKLIFLDAGSGATQTVPGEMIRQVRKVIDNILVVGGGIRTPEQAFEVARSGADIVVIGNHLEYHPERISSMAKAIHSAGSPSVKIS